MTDSSCGEKLGFDFDLLTFFLSGVQPCRSVGGGAAELTCRSVSSDIKGTCFSTP